MVTNSQGKQETYEQNIPQYEGMTTEYSDLLYEDSMNI